MVQLTADDDLIFLVGIDVANCSKSHAATKLPKLLPGKLGSVPTVHLQFTCARKQREIQLSLPIQVKRKELCDLIPRIPHLLDELKRCSIETENRYDAGRG